jgi:hypothetical protein
MKILEKHAQNGILCTKTTATTNEYTLNRPISILISKGVVNALNQQYNKTLEKGGIMALSYDEKGAYINEIFFVANTSKFRSAYLPDPKKWVETLNLILLSGRLPIVFHTHPTTLGLQNYDSKRSNFYLKSSLQDRKLTKTGLKVETDLLKMPECIFVQDARFKAGYSLVFYGNGFPKSFAFLTQNEFYLTGAIAAAKILGISNFLVIPSSILGFAYEEMNRPKYIDLDNQILIKA